MLLFNEFRVQRNDFFCVNASSEEVTTCMLFFSVFSSVWVWCTDAWGNLYQFHLRGSNWW